MLIFGADKFPYRNIGYVADFCPMCRAPRAFQLRRVGGASQDYNIDSGEGALLGYERRCEDCEVTLDAKPTSYASIASERTSMPELTARTFPRLTETYRATMDLDRLARRSPGSLTAAERRALILTPLLILSARVEQRLAATQVDKEVGYTVLALIAALVLDTYLIGRVAPESIGRSMLAILVVGIGAVIWQISAARGRFIRREILPRLAESLRPLSPTDAELNVAFEELRGLRHKLGSRKSARALRAAIDRIGEPTSGHHGKE